MLVYQRVYARLCNRPRGKMRGLAAKKHRGSAGACAGGPLLLQLSVPDSTNSSPFFSLHSGSCRMQRRFGVGSVEASCVFHPINVH